MNAQFSVLIPIYFKENRSNFDAALESLAGQTLKPSEVVIVKDGIVGKEIDKVIKQYFDKLPLAIVELEKNSGLGVALQHGLLASKYGLIARMDSDDIARSDRFEKQLAYLNEHPEVDIVGSWISEFETNENEVCSVRKLPLQHNALYTFAKRRSPLNHMTVMFRKQPVLDAGNYLPFLWFEDYYLWARMMLKGSKFANIPEYLVHARAGKEMINKRHGLKYARNELALQREFYNIGFTNLHQFLLNIILRVPPRLLPKKMLEFIYSLLHAE